jgi:hypothetical protein
VPNYGTIKYVKRKHQKTLEAIYARPTSANIRWTAIESLLVELGAEIKEREGSRIAVVFPKNAPAVFHRPHPSPMADKGAVQAMRNWLESMGYKP